MKSIFLNTETHPASFAHPVRFAVQNTSFLLDLYLQLYYILRAADTLILQTLRGRDISCLWQTIIWKETWKQFTVPVSNKQLYDCTKSVLHTYAQAFFKK